jgi:hypothetical protein
MMTIRRIAVCCIFAVAIYSLPAHAAIVGVTGDGDLLAALVDPTSAAANFFDDDVIHGWDELQAHLLTEDVVVDIEAPGTYTNLVSLGTFVIPMGTLLSSHLLYFDPALDSSRTATFTFDSPIIGVIVRNGTSDADDRLLATDFLGHPNTTYPGAFYAQRGLEMEGAESVTSSADRLTLTAFLTAGDPGDQIRVLTSASGDTVIPEPATSLLIGGGLVAASLLRRTRLRLR